jgi:hypothetical protein
MEKVPVRDRAYSLKSSLAIVVAAVALSGCSENSSGEKTTAPKSPVKQKVEQTDTTTDSQPQAKQEGPSSQADAYEPPVIDGSTTPEEVATAYFEAVNHSDPQTQCKLTGEWCGMAEIKNAVPPNPVYEIDRSYVVEDRGDTVVVQSEVVGGPYWGLWCAEVSKDAPEVVDRTIVYPEDPNSEKSCRGF